MMELNIEEKKSGKKILKTEQKQHTIMSLMRRYLWDAGIDAGYDEGHPYIGGSNLIVESKDIKKDVKEACKTIKKDLKEFKAEF